MPIFRDRWLTSLTCLAVLLATAPLSAQETPEQRDARMKWWREARFGMFIHWGVYAELGGVWQDKEIGGIGEWIQNRGKIPCADYQAVAKRFNPVKYDPVAWVRLAKAAGMKYLVITSKHHDGFALFDSAVTKWDVVDATPYGKDLLKPWPTRAAPKASSWGSTTRRPRTGITPARRGRRALGSGPGRRHG